MLHLVVKATISLKKEMIQIMKDEAKDKDISLARYKIHCDLILLVTKLMSSHPIEFNIAALKSPDGAAESTPRALGLRMRRHPRHGKPRRRFPDAAVGVRCSAHRVAPPRDGHKDDADDNSIDKSGCCGGGGIRRRVEGGGGGGSGAGGRRWRWRWERRGAAVHSAEARADGHERRGHHPG